MNATLTLALIPALVLRPLPGQAEGAAAAVAAPFKGCRCGMDQPAANTAVSEPASEPSSGSGCGWFDSSWALHQGLSVTELPDSDGMVAALWFPTARRHRLTH